jgi:hypothetical protein
MKKILAEVNNSLNDISYRQILKKLTNEINKINQSRTEEHSYILQDSYISTDYTNKVEDAPAICTMKKNHTNIIEFDGMKWIMQDDGRWIPPDGAEIHKIQKDEQYPMQSDSGANRIVTDNMELLKNVKHIKPIPMGGCNKDNEAAITCTALGTLSLTATNGTTIKVQAYYSAEVDGTIISPTTIITQHRDKYTGWTQHADCDKKQGYITLLSSA